jgi:hypothetical protein
MTDIIKFKEIDGLQLGVMNDETPFLTQRSLATICGVTPRAIRDWGQNAPSVGDPLSFCKLADLLVAQSFEEDFLYRSITFKGNEISAYPDAVCMAFLEYYAFEADVDSESREIARNNYRKLARRTLREFIYRLVGYDPNQVIPRDWQHFHDRMLLNSVPINYFSVFKETADIVISSIREGLIVDSHTVPDISVGQMWSRYWVNNNLDNTYGERIRHPHQYPDDFPQSNANNDINPFIYPIESLGIFRTWLNSEYLPQQFPNYLQRKVKQGAIPATSAELLLRAVIPKELE